jgi:hypothetical protein
VREGRLLASVRLTAAAWRRAMAAAAVSALLASAIPAAPAWAVTADEALGPLDQYATAKARALAGTYRSQLTDLYRYLYHCVPWVAVQKNGIGFRSPKGATGDERYLTIWIRIEQGDDPGFSSMRPAERASAMFSRYGIPLLRRMASMGAVTGDGQVEGFGVVLSWIKPGRARPAVNETLVAFVDRAPTLELAARTIDLAEITRRARFSLFDGTTELPRPQLDAWDDPFLGTFKLKDYVPPPGTTC